MLTEQLSKIISEIDTLLYSAENRCVVFNVKTDMLFVIKYDSTNEANVRSLIISYLMEFRKENVGLVILYGDSDGQEKKQTKDKIKESAKQMVNRCRSKLNYKSYPKIFVWENSNENVQSHAFFKGMGLYIDFELSENLFKAMACGVWVATIPDGDIFKKETPYSLDELNIENVRAKLRTVYEYRHYDRHKIRNDFMKIYARAKRSWDIIKEKQEEEIRKLKFVEEEKERKQVESVCASYKNDGFLNIEIVAPVLEPSGYSASARDVVISLKNYGHNVSVVNYSFDDQRPKLQKYEKELTDLINKKINPDIRIFVMTPNVSYNILHHGWGSIKSEVNNKRTVPSVTYFYWETSKIPELWVKDLNYVDGVFVPCNYHKKILMETNVEKGVYVVGHVVNTSIYGDVKLDMGIPNDKFVFYSIFQWTERKNPEGLLRAYWSAFKGNKDVVLVLKTYLAKVCAEQTNMIKNNIEQTKKCFPISLGGERKPDEYPEVKIITDLLSDEEIASLHKQGDCFVLLHRGEGMGMPIIEAMSNKKPVIATKYFACEDYLNDENSYPVDYQMSPVWGMEHIPWYDGTQYWAEPNLLQAQQHMKDVYNNREMAKSKGVLACSDIEEKYNSKKVALNFTEAIRDVIQKFKESNGG